MITNTVACEMGSHGRLYDFWCSTEEQLRLSTAENYHDNYLVQLRLNLLAFRTLVVPDTAIIDGCFFGQTTPQELTEWCGRGLSRPVLPIEIRTRRKSFEESMAEFLLRPDRETLNDYPLQLLKDPEIRAAMADGLRETPASRLEDLLTLEPSVPRAIARLLVDILKAQGVTYQRIEQFLPFWEAWVEAERGGQLRVVQWSKPIDVLRSANSDRLSPTRELVTAEGRDAYTQVYDLIERGYWAKSDALNILDINPSQPEPSSHSTPLNGYARDAAAIIAWYDSTRSRAIAHQHNCTFAYDQVPLFSNSGEGAYRGLATAPDDQDLNQILVVELPKDFRAVLQSADPAKYRTLVDAHEGQFRELWNNPTAASLRKVMEITYGYFAAENSAIRFSKTEKLVRVFGQLLAAGAAQQIGGPLAGLSMLLVSEAAIRIADSSSRRQAVRSVVEYMTRRA